MRIIISYTSVGLWATCLMAWGIIGMVAATCAYDSGPMDVGPLFVAIVAAFLRAPISVRIAFINSLYSPSFNLKAAFYSLPSLILI